MSDKDILFLLPPGFEDKARREFCPECAEVWGVLHYFPAIKAALEIRYVSLEHPRTPICDLLGDGRWNAPTLVLAPANAAAENAQRSNGKAYLASAREIATYFAARYGTPFPRGS